jgi:hypothetical protein
LIRLPVGVGHSTSYFIGALIVELRKAGLGYLKIAETLNAERRPTK